MNTLTFTAIVNAANEGVEMTDSACELLSLARDLDSLAERLADASRSMSERFTRYAEDVARGVIFEPPTGWSTLRDMDRDAATYAAKLDAFKVLFRIVIGKSLREVRAMIEEGNKKVR